MINLPSLPDVHMHVAESHHSAPIPDHRLAFDDGIICIGGVRLQQLARPGMKVVIAFTDATRYSPDRLLVGAIMQELHEAGIDNSDITLLCATGLHRPMTDAERLAKLGPEIIRQVAIVDHNALDASGLVDLGTIDGRPVVVNRRCVDADLVIATGVVEPHQYAGYSGGAKTVVIGCGGEATIAATHGAEMLDHPGTRLGAIDGNPFQSFVRAAGERIGLDYVVNVLLDEEGHVIEAAAGRPAQVHDHLAAHGRECYQTPVEQRAHLAVAGVNPAKSTNLYQASRAATYLALADRTPLLPGAPIVIPASIPEGAGDGTGEQRFFEILSNATSPSDLVDELRRTGFPAGAQRAYILAKVMAEHPVIVAGPEHPEIVLACHLLTAPTLGSALEMAVEIARRRFGDGPLELLAVPNALVTLPRWSGTEVEQP
jgi:nickel-dependent lactate racemase